MSRRPKKALAATMSLFLSLSAFTSPAQAFAHQHVPDSAVLRPGPGGFVPIPATRLLDTRSNGALLQAGETRLVTIGGGYGSPVPAQAAAVALTVTVVDPAAGYLSVWPADLTQPNTSVLNFDNHQNIANSVTVRLSPSGQIAVRSSSATHLVIDVQGWYAAPRMTTNEFGQTWPIATPGGGFFGVGPTRLLDTRTGIRMGAGEARLLPLVVPVDLAGSSLGSVVLNVTASSPSSGGFVSIVGNGESFAETSSLNFGNHGAVANQVTAHVGVGNAIVLYSSAPVDLIVDLMGIYTGGDPMPGGYVAVPGQRLLDTRQSAILGNASFEPRTREWDLGIASTAGVPVSAAAVTLNLTALDASSEGYFTVWSDGVGRPTSSVLNVQPNDVAASAITIGLGSNNGVGIYTDTNARFLVDVTGWFRSPYVG